MNPLLFFFWSFLKEDIYADEFKTTRVEGHHHQRVRSTTFTNILQELLRSGDSLPSGVNLREAQTGSLTLNLADGQPRVRVLDDRPFVPFHWYKLHKYH